MPYLKIVKTFLKPAIASSLMFILLWLLNVFVLNPYVTNNIYKTLIDVGVGVLLYGGFCVLLREPLVRNSLKKIFHK